MSHERYKQDLNNYNWLQNEVDLHECEQAMRLGFWILRHLDPCPKSVIDFGCSSGIYLLPYLTQRLEVLGIDGATGVGKWIPNNFQVVDLRIPWNTTKKYDLSLNIETAEHIEPEYADVFMDSLCNAANVCFFSAARKNQGGEGHWNEQDKPYWLEKFASRGLVSHPLNEEMMFHINTDEAYEHCHWMRWNSMLLYRKP